MESAAHPLDERSTSLRTRPLQLALVNMPFADWILPSFALSQLASLARRELPGQVDISVNYLNQDFAVFFGLGLYSSVISDFDHQGTGIGEWIFRQVAFPQLADNSQQYFDRYYRGAKWAAFQSLIAEKRSSLEQFCLELIEKYRLDKMDVVGLTSMFSQTTPSLALARLIKDRNPRVLILLGGANCEVPMGGVIAKNVPYIDYVFSGPALRSFPEFLSYIIKGDIKSPDSITGILSKTNCHEEQTRASVGLERDIDDFFEPDFESYAAALRAQPLLTAEIGKRDGPYLFFETSRGCWWGERSHCTFCGLNGLDMNYRNMSPAVALRQFNWLFTFAPWCVSYHCTDNIMPRNYAKEVLPLLNPPENSSIFYEVKLPMSEKDMQVLSEAHVNRIQPGIEALATSTLKLMAKGTTAFLNVQFLKNCVRFNIKPEWNLLIGFPGEDVSVYEKYDRDLPLLRHLPPPVGVFMVRFDRYSPYYVRRDEYGLDLQPLDYYPLTFPFETADLMDMAYFFHDANLGPYFINAATWMGPLSQHVERWREDWTERAATPDLSMSSEGDGNWVVHDSRFGATKRMVVDNETAALIKKLSSPIRSDALAGELDLPRETLSARLEFLRRNRWLFEEEDRLMSLIVAETIKQPDRTVSALTWR
jgi:ribosomal peptide maturation radical SAM protein 1